MRKTSSSKTHNAGTVAGSARIFWGNLCEAGSRASDGGATATSVTAASGVIRPVPIRVVRLG
jgi:hypothetical protein